MMPLPFDRTIRAAQARPFLKDLETLFAAMDLRYQEAADHYGFHCRGCEDNCCFTRFYHHTLLEFLYLNLGFQALLPVERSRLLQRAAELKRLDRPAAASGAVPRLLCPLNVDGGCSLYPFRPMICRLHGIPHELQAPGRQTVYSPGCHAFDARHRDQDYYPFDRTPFFVQMAALEQDLRRSLAWQLKIKMTVAQMVAAFEPFQPPGPEAGPGPQA